MPTPMQRDDAACSKERLHLVLTGADRDAFVAAVLDPPKPTDKLIAALRRHRDLLG